MKRKKRGKEEVKLIAEHMHIRSIWLKFAVIFAVIAFLAAIPLLLLSFGISSPEFLISISNIIYFPVMSLFIRIIYIPLYAVGIGLSAKTIFLSILAFGILLYFAFGALIGWIIKKIKHLRNKTNKHG